MTDDNAPTDKRPLATLSRPKKVIWLVSGVLMVADRDLPGALRTLADHADLKTTGTASVAIGGVILHGRTRLTWNIITPQDERLSAFVEHPDPEAAYRLLTLAVTPLLGEPG